MLRDESALKKTRRYSVDRLLSRGTHHYLWAYLVSKAEVTKEVNVLLDLKGQYKTLTGQDFKPANNGKKEKKKEKTKATKAEQAVKKEEQKPSQDERTVKKVTRYSSLNIKLKVDFISSNIKRLLDIRKNINI